MITISISVLWICQMALMFYSQTILASGETTAFADLNSPSCNCTDNRIDDIICALVNLNPPLAYRCPASNICILIAWMMDGKMDCPEGEDENCTIVGNLNGKGCRVTTISAMVATSSETTKTSISMPTTTTSLTTTTITDTLTTDATTTTTGSSTTAIAFRTCRANGDPHFTTFDEAYFSPQEPSGKWFLAAEPVTAPNGIVPWSVWFTTSDCNGYIGATCILQVEIDIFDLVVVFGTNGYFRVDGLNVIAPWYYPTKKNPSVWVVNYGTEGHTLNTINNMISVTFSGVNSIQIQIPANTYFNGTQGVCGDSNGDPTDDLICPDGSKNVNNCWERIRQSTITAINPPIPVQTTMLTTATTTTTTTKTSTSTKPSTTQLEIQFVACRASGDPHFTTFDGYYYSPQQPPGPWFLAVEPITVPNATIPWSVWFTTNFFYDDQPLTIIVQVEIDIDDQVVVFGRNGYFRVNSLNVIAPWYYPSKGNATVWVVNYGSAGHTLNSINRVSVTYDGVYSMQIQIPLNLYFNETQGVCGNSNSNPNDDASCPDGGNMNTCWERYPNSTVSPTTAHTVQPYTATTTKTASRATCDNKAQQEINLQCAIITNKVGPFAACAVKAAELAIGYYLSCSYDLCYATNASNAICTLLQSFADVCMQVIPNTILQWRSANFCPQICPKNSHYKTCASSCPATCSDTNAPANCKFPCRGDCTCDSSFVQDNGVCIRPELCGCRDSAGYYHQSNSTWVTDDCKENCSCGANYTVNCRTKTLCNFHATCTVHDGKRNCYCLDGYTGDGEICQSITSTTNIAYTTKPITSFVTCRATGDPHFTTFDGYYYSPQPPPGPWFLAAEPTAVPNGTIPWSVWFTTNVFYSNGLPTRIAQVEIDVDGQVVIFGTDGYLRVNSLNVIAPWYYPSKENATFWVVNYGSAGHTLTTINSVSVTFDGIYSLQIQIPLSYLYFNNTHGVCGTYNSDPHDDASCPDGGNLDTCWKRKQPVAVSPATSLYTITNLTASYTFCIMTPELEIAINQLCSIFTSKDGPFASCGGKSSELAVRYEYSCTYDLCYSQQLRGAPNVLNDRCALLQSFADACMQDLPKTVLQWRNASFCPQICPQNSHYETCTSSCPATCSDTNAPANCKFPCRGDCTCNSGYILDNGVCIRPDLCGCRDRTGYYHQLNSTWVTNDCNENCSCGANYTVNCRPKTLCNPHAHCAVQDGNRNCYCLDGYTGDGETCQPTAMVLLATTTAITTTTTTRILCTWRYLGCYGSVPWDAVMLINGYDFIRPANLTLDSCQAYCMQTYKYKFISLNYGMDCHCGIGLSPNSTKGEEKGCYMTCPGNKQQFCGGPWCYSVYECR